MPSKKDPSVLEELIRALQDDAVLAAIGAIFDKRLLAMSAEIAELKTDNLGCARPNSGEPTYRSPRSLFEAT